MTRHLRLALSGALAIYTAIVLAITLWPSHVDKPVESTIRDTISSTTTGGWRAAEASYVSLEQFANIALFVPLGFLLAVLIAKRMWWIAPVVGAALSTVIELSQLAFLPERTASVSDVITNTIGALVGALLVVVARVISSRYEKREPTRVPSERTLGTLVATR